MSEIKEKYCICATCGSQLSDSETSFCINGHDDWLERDDNFEIFSRASQNIGLTPQELMKRILKTK